MTELRTPLFLPRSTLARQRYTILPIIRLAVAYRHLIFRFIVFTVTFRNCWWVAIVLIIFNLNSILCYVRIMKTIHQSYA